MGNNTDSVQLKPNHVEELHQDQWKAFEANSITGQSSNLYTSRLGLISLVVKMEKVLVWENSGNIRVVNGHLEFPTEGQGPSVQEAKWEPMYHSVLHFSSVCLNFRQKRWVYTGLTATV